jgi:hypothetical protein
MMMGRPDIEIAIQDLIQNKGLYTPIPVSSDIEFEKVRPYKMELYCMFCDKLRPFSFLHQHTKPGTEMPPDLFDNFYLRGAAYMARFETRYHILEYSCMDCNTSYVFYVEVNKVEGYARKVGQVPPYVTSVPPDVKKLLGKDGSDLFHKGLMCISQGYGLGANSYFRRILEDKLTPILNRVLELRKRESAPPEELGRIDKAINAHDFSAKTRIAYEVAPPSLKSTAGNPFKIIHDNYSAGIHEGDEATNITIATNLKNALVFIIHKLDSEIALHREFDKSLKAASQFKLPKSE